MTKTDYTSLFGRENESDDDDDFMPSPVFFTGKGKSRKNARSPSSSRLDRIEGKQVQLARELESQIKRIKKNQDPVEMGKISMQLQQSKAQCESLNNNDDVHEEQY